ncbi:type II secretion system protein [Pseudothauera lacus]|nr:type II secretion system protein [Pseudothauera lacus]
MCAEHRPCRGFTLIELIVVIVVLSAGLVGILAAFNNTVSRSADPMLQQQAIALAEGYLEEIMGMRCPGVSAGGTARGEWAFVADYDGVDDQPPVDVSGAELAGLSGYRVQVTVAGDTLAGVPGCRITVLVNGDGASSELIGFRAED